MLWTDDETVCRLAKEFMRDTIVALQAVGHHEGVNFLNDQKKYDDSDIDACVTFLGDAGLVTQEWVDRLTRMNIDHSWDEELEELTGYLSEQRVDNNVA